MTRPRRPPRLFIGSSVEGVDVAYAIQENLDFDAETTVWSQGIFRPSRTVLEELIASLSRFDFAAFVFSTDDVVQLRGRNHPAVRDNVIFELGLFLGALGLARCFFVVPRSGADMHLPTDLLGANPLTYAASRSDDNLVAALGPACNQVRRAFRAAAATRQAPLAGFVPVALEDYVEQWNGPILAKARSNIREVVLDHYSDEFQAVRPDMKRVFAFLEGLSEAVLAKSIDEDQARATFNSAILSFWPVAESMLAPPNREHDFWDPLPQIAQLFARWSKQSGKSK